MGPLPMEAAGSPCHDIFKANCRPQIGHPSAVSFSTWNQFSIYSQRFEIDSELASQEDDLYPETQCREHTIAALQLHSG